MRDKLRDTFQIIDDPVSEKLGRVDPGIKVSELCLSLQEGPEDLHLKEERAELSDSLPRLTNRHLRLASLAIRPQLVMAEINLVIIYHYCNMIWSLIGDLSEKILQR